jgi:hypothetical protein
MESAFRKNLTRVLGLLAMLALCAGIVWAQGGTGELTGVLSDPTGAVVSGAEVTLTNDATGDKRTTATTDAGIYRFSALPVVGSYTLETAPKGFKAVKVANIVISVGATTTRDIKAEVGASTEQVTVEAGAQLIQTEDAAVSQLIDRRVWEQMPLEARNPNDFVNLVAGAVPEQIAGGTFRGAAVNGTRTGTGNFMVEGVDNNEQGQGGVSLCGTACGQGGANTSISPDAIQEYRVISHDFNAEYGKAGGFVTDTVLKSGTNQWHGSLYEYNRIQALTANDWFSNNADLRDHLVRNQFGGSVGGPIVKDKTFIFGTVEIHRLRVSSPVSGTATTQQFYNFVNDTTSTGFANYVNTNLCDSTCVSTAPGGGGTVGPIFNQLLAKWPLAMPLVNSNIDCSTDTTGACLGQGAYTFGFPYPVPVYANATESSITPTDQNRFSIKFDHKLTDKDQFSATLLGEFVTFDCNFCGSDTTFGVPEHNPNQAWTGGLSWTHTVSPTVLNQARFGYVRRIANFTDPGSAGIPEQYTIDALVAGFGGSTSIPQFFTENMFQYKDDLSVTHGKHSFKFGGEYRRTRNGSSFQADRNGHFSPWSVEDLITDAYFTDNLDNNFSGYGAYGYGGWYYAAAAVNPTNNQLPNFYRGYRANELGIYAQDDWRVNSKLTLNLGLRWDYFGPPHNYQANIDSNYYFGTPVTPITGCVNSSGTPVDCSSNPFLPIHSTFYAYEATARAQVRNGSIWNKDTNNFAPRFGFAYDALGNQKVVVRGAFGIFYDRLYNNVFENIRFNSPFYADQTAGVFASGTSLGPLKQPGLFTIPFTSNAAFNDPAFFPRGLPKPVPRHIDQNLKTAYYEQYSFGVEYELAKDYALEANYLGTLGRDLVGILNRNTYDGRTALGSSLSIRPNPVINNDNARGNFYSSNYNALQLTLRKRFSAGLNFNVNYTYAKALDQLSDVFRSKTGQISATDVQNIRYDYGPADFDVRHRVVASFNYDLPFMKSNRWLGGWAVNGIYSFNTGSPIGLYNSGADPNKDGTRTDRPQWIGPGTDYKSSISGSTVKNSDGSHTYQYLNIADFGAVPVPAGGWANSNLGRNMVPGPSFNNFDFGVDKSFKVTEGTKLIFQANFFDIFNHPNFQNPDGNFADTAFGQSQSTYGDTGGHRVTQLALRFEF